MTRTPPSGSSRDSPSAGDAASPVAADQLRQLLDELDDARAEAREIAGGLTDRQLWWRPGPDRWSVGECLDHLVRTGEAYLPGIDRGLARAEEEALTSRGPYSRGFLGRWLVRGMEPPPRLSVPAPELFLPRRGSDAAPPPGGGDPAPGGGGRDGGDPGPDGAAEPLPRFLALQDRLEQRVERAAGLDLEAVRVPSPVLSFLSINLYAALAYLTAHQRRHLWQAETVTEADGWPGTGGA